MSMNISNQGVSQSRLNPVKPATPKNMESVGEKMDEVKYPTFDFTDGAKLSSAKSNEEPSFLDKASSFFRNLFSSSDTNAQVNSKTESAFDGKEVGSVDNRAKDLATRLSENPNLMKSLQSLRGNSDGETFRNIKNMMEKAKLAVDYPGAEFSNVSQHDLEGISKATYGLNQYTQDKLLDRVGFKNDDFTIYRPFNNVIQQQMRFEPKEIFNEAGVFDKKSTTQNFELKISKLKEKLDKEGIPYEESRDASGKVLNFFVSVDFKLFRKLDMNIQPSKSEDPIDGTVVRNTMDPKGSLSQQEDDLLESIKTNTLKSHTVILNGKTYEFPPLGNKFDSASAKKVDSVWQLFDKDVENLREQKKLAALSNFKDEVAVLVTQKNKNVDHKILDNVTKVLNSDLSASDRMVAGYYLLDRDLYDIKKNHNGKIPDELYDLEKALQKLIDSPY